MYEMRMILARSIIRMPRTVSMSIVLFSYEPYPMNFLMKSMVACMTNAMPNTDIEPVMNVYVRCLLSTYSSSILPNSLKKNAKENGQTILATNTSAT